MSTSQVPSTVDGFLNPIGGDLLDDLTRNLTSQQLAAALDNTSQQIQLDIRQLRKTVSESKPRMNLAKFDELHYLIAKTLPPGVPDPSDEDEFLKFCLGRFFLCKKSIERVIQYMKGDFNELLSNKADVEAQEEGPGWTRIGRYLHMLRYFVRFYQERVILRELAKDYAVWLDISTKLLTEGQPDYSGVPHDQVMALWDFSGASRDLLLEGTSGRFSSPPLVRTVIELALTRSLLELPKHSSKYGKNTIQRTPRFRLADLFDTARSGAVNIQLNPGNEALEVLYKWGNQTVHNGTTYPMEELVFAQAFVDDFTHGKLGPLYLAKTASQIDAMIEKLRNEGKITLLPSQGTGERGMSVVTLEDVQTFMFAYRELHLPSKINAVSAIYRLYKEMKSKDLWLDNQNLRKNKDAILSALGMQVISSSMMVMEDFVKMCYCMSQDMLIIPITMARYAELGQMEKHISDSLVAKGDRAFIETLHYLDENDLNAPDFAFLSEDDRKLVMRQHFQNAKALKHTYEYAVRVYETFRKAYNKHKHGHPFLFSMGSTQDAPPPFDKVSPAIPYFADENNLRIAEPVFVGELVLDKIHLLIEGQGGVFSLLRDLTTNVTLRCKCGGRKVIANKGYGPPVLSEKGVQRFKEIVNEFEKRFVVDRTPKQLQLSINSNIKKSNWDYFDQDWAMT